MMQEGMEYGEVGWLGWFVNHTKKRGETRTTGVEGSQALNQFRLYSSSGPFRLSHDFTRSVGLS